MFEILITVVHVLVAVFLILVVLLQAGRGGGVSGAFGGGAGAAMGQRSAATVLGKMTAISAGIFMVTSMILAVMSTPTANDPTRSDMEEIAAEEKPAEAAASTPPSAAPVSAVASEPASTPAAASDAPPAAPSSAP
jgi:preprotein translocase subunit SecG